MVTAKEILYWLANNKWIYLAYWLPLVIFSMRFYAKNKLAISEAFFAAVVWARHSLETAGQASPEKITAFVIINTVYIPGRLVFVWKITEPIHLLYGSLIDAALVLILYRIITPSQILELKSGLNPAQKDDKSNPQ